MPDGEGELADQSGHAWKVLRARRRRCATVEPMTIQRMDHVGINVDDLASAKEFFLALGLTLQGEATVEGDLVDHVVGLEGVRSDIAMMEAPDGHGRIELVKFHTPSSPDGERHAPPNAPGIRHLTFAVDDVDAAVASVRAKGQRRGARRRGGELQGHLSNLLRPRPGENDLRAGGADRLSLRPSP